MIQFFKKSLANKISLYLSLIMVIFHLSISGFLLQYSYHQILTSRINETTLQAKNISKDVENIFENARIVTRQMALHPEIVNYLKTVDNKDAIRNNPYYETVLNTLIRIKESNKIHFLAWVANEKANFYLDSLGIVPDDTYDVKKRPWYAVGMGAKDTDFTSPYVEWGTQRVVVSCIKPLRENKEVYGFVVMDIVLENIPLIFKSSSTNSSDKFFLVSGDGAYIFHDNPEKMLKTNINDANDPLNPYYDFIKSTPQSSKSILYESKPYLLDSYPVEGSNWIVISLIDQNDIQNQIFNQGLLITGMLLLVLTISIFLISYTVKKSTRPYQDMLIYAQDIAAGDFSKNIPEKYLLREDEMGQLSKSFQLIINTFRNENIILEQKINEKNTELQAQYQFILETEKSASLGNLVAGVAHEINTPLGISLSTASYLDKMNRDLRLKLSENRLSKTDLKEMMDVLNESLQLINSNLTRAAELVKSFKQVAVDQSSEIKSAFDLKETIADVILSLRHEYKRTQIELKNNCATNLVLDSYPGAITQIFTNLILNSLQHGFADIDEGIINIDAALENDILRIVYTDTGKGISAENLKKIYDPFYTTNRQKGNSGLGMHIVMNLVTQKLKGSIHCESSPGNGVQFTIEIPV